MKTPKETLLMNMHVVALSNFQRRAVYNNLPLIYAFMKESPVGFWGVLQKLLCLKTQWAEKSDRQKQKNGGLITDNHVMA